MNIRTLTVELLRAGTRHNQLLSPLTQYLGVCGNAAASTVSLPYEHRDFESRLAELSYKVTADEDPGRRQRLLDKMGQEISEILSQVNGLAGALSPPIEDPDTLTQLRIVVSASELAMLPFEASKVPTATGASGVWLALQARAPVCITRHIRSVSAEGVRWPTDPRILFVAGPDTPFVEHRQALEGTMAPWRDAEGTLGDRLVCLEKATLALVMRTVEAAAEENRPFTHVHVLAHGARLDEMDRYSPIGVQLHDQVVSGVRLASALTAVRIQGTCRPVVVTLATCDSGAQTDVRTTVASAAHDLHDQGIPLVVASQFPLSVAGSIPFVELFYAGQLWGDHPLVSLYEVRLRLHGSMEHDVHDWASLVVYEAFPSDLDAQLEDLRYWQTRRAQDNALQRLEDALKAHVKREAPLTRERYEQLKAGATAFVARLPTDGPYEVECAGLRAAAMKRMAQVALLLADACDDSADWSPRLLDECLSLLEAARAEYWRATKAYLTPTSERTRTKSNLHWLLGQVLSLDVVLARRPLDLWSWTAAVFAAQVDTTSPSDIERGWAHVSIAELALLRLAEDDLSPDERAGFAEETILNVTRMVDLLGRSSEPGKATRRQFDRYVTCWGNPDLRAVQEKLGLPDRRHWQLENGLVATAKRVVDMLAPPSARWAVAAEEPDRAADPATSPPTIPPSATPPQESGGGRTASSAPAKASPANLGKPRPVAIFDVEMLPAENGDCLWIEYGDPAQPRRILIDCGAESTARLLAPRLAVAGAFELFVLTHIDADHISGVVPLFANGSSKARFEDIWFNGWRQVSPFLSVKQAEKFSKLLEDPAQGLPWNRAITASGAKSPAPVVVADGKPLPSFPLRDGMQLTLLSPGAGQLKRMGKEWHKALVELEPAKAMLGRKAPPPKITDFASFDVEALARKPEKPDPSIPNGSSIALLAEFDGRAVLLTGDAYPQVLVSSIQALQRERGREGERLKLDACKLSHHGSANATTSALLDAIDCRRYLVSTNGNIFYHPDRETIARVITHGGPERPEPTLVFNYRSAYNGLWDEPSLKTRYGYRTEYPAAGAEGLRVSL
jgi:hypothetical protein